MSRAVSATRAVKALRTRVPVVVATAILLSGCGAEPIDAGTAASFQSDVRAIASAAAADPSGAIVLAQRLKEEVESARAAGDVTEDRATSIGLRIDAVIASLEAGQAPVETVPPAEVPSPVEAPEEAVPPPAPVPSTTPPVEPAPAPLPADEGEEDGGESDSGGAGEEAPDPGDSSEDSAAERAAEQQRKAEEKAREAAEKAAEKATEQAEEQAEERAKGNSGN